MQTVPACKTLGGINKDKTYIKTEQGYLYLSLATDLYSKRIMGYNLSDNMKVESSAVAMRMAIANRQYNTVRITTLNY